MAAAVEVEPAVVEVDSPAGVGKKKKDPPEPTATLTEFYQFLSASEAGVLFIGCIGAIGMGLGNPFMLIAFQQLFGTMGDMMIVRGVAIPFDKMVQLLMTMVYLGIGVGAGALISITAVEYTTASQMLKYKKAYLKAVLRQDVGWYDVSNPEELSTQFAESMVKMKKGFKSISMICTGLGYGIGSAVMAFLPSIGHWEVALVVMGTVPLLIGAASLMMYVVTNGSKLVDKAYGQAGGIATEVRARAPPLRCHRLGRRPCPRAWSRS